MKKEIVMNLPKTLFAMAGLVLAFAARPAPCFAVEKPDSPATPEAGTLDEIAILGELIRVELGRVYARGGRADLYHLRGLFEKQTIPHPHGAPVEAGVGRPHGLYVRGHGVVLQIEAPRPRPSTEQSGSAAAAEGPSEWELARRRLRGERGGPVGPMTDDCLACHHAPAAAAGGGHPRTADLDAVRDALLGVLARNGHNLRSLRGDELLTVAVAFRAAPAAHAALGTDASDPAMLAPLVSGEFAGLGLRRQGALGQLLENVENGTSAAKDPERLAADLHLRQGNYAEAVAAYDALIEKYRASSKPGSLIRTLEARLAQASIALGDYPRARELLARLEKPPAGAHGAGAEAEQESAAGTAGISQLVITATREQLAAAGSGALPAAEFARQVEVELRRPDFTATAAASLPDGGTRLYRPRIETVVQAVHDENALVVLSAGRDRSVQTGERFTVFRDRDKIGEVEVVEIHPNLSGARILSVMEGQEIRAGDRASSDPK